MTDARKPPPSPAEAEKSGGTVARGGGDDYNGATMPAGIYTHARLSAVDRFMSKWEPEPNTGCWLWTASVGAHGYGQLARGGREGMMTAHRASWMLHVGPIPAGMFVCHRCDTRRCVNPNHLFLGTATDNARDMSNKGRSSVQRDRSLSVGGHNALLSADIADEIRRVFVPRHPVYGGRPLALRFGVRPATISAVVRGRNWR